VAAQSERDKGDIRGIHARKATSLAKSGWTMALYHLRGLAAQTAHLHHIKFTGNWHVFAFFLTANVGSLMR
jgi:hypothetical protein